MKRDKLDRLEQGARGASCTPGERNHALANIAARQEEIQRMLKELQDEMAMLAAMERGHLAALGDGR